MHAFGPPEGPPLSMPGQQFFDEAGIWAAFLVQAVMRGPRALWGQVIDLSVHEVGLVQQVGDEQYGLAGQIKTRATNFGPPPGGIWQCRDGSGGHRRPFGPPMGGLRRSLGMLPTCCPIRSIATGSCGSSCSTCSRDIIADQLSTWSVRRVRGGGTGGGSAVRVTQTPAQFADDPQPAARRFFIPSVRAGTGTGSRTGADPSSLSLHW